MDGMRVVVPVHFHGTMAANGTFRWLTPCGLTLTHVSLAGSNTNTGTVQIGNTGSGQEAAYMAAKDIGDGAAAGYGRADFVDGEQPHVPAGTTLLVTVDFNGAGNATAVADCSVVLTFLEG
jgi:hypothetical protein